MARIHINNRKDWLLERADMAGGCGIGGSDAPVVIGLSPWKSSITLWRERVNREVSRDISSEEAVSRGIKYEPILRDLFIASHADYEVEHYPFDIVFRAERPWLFATLDGEITKEDGRKGVLEIKTCSPNGKSGWDKWNGNVPDYYYAQICHQLLATGYDFAILYACLISHDGTMTIREYEFEADECRDDMEWLATEEAKFVKCVREKKMPKVQINL